MVRNYPDNPFNVGNVRNMRNTKKWTYNCGGYALGIYSWYCPFDKKDENYWLKTKGKFREKEISAIAYMLKDFDFLNLIEEKEVKARNFDIDKYTIIAFRFSCDDFHYWKLGRNYNWYDKMGSSRYINRHAFNDVFKEWGNYRGKIYYFIKAR